MISRPQRMTLACIAQEAVPVTDFDTSEERHTLERLERLGLVERRGGFVFVTAAGRVEAAKVETTP